MRGLDRLIDIRRQRMRPEGLMSLSTDGCDRAYEGWCVVEPSDHPALTDLRPFSGLSVMVSGEEFDAVDAWARAVAAAGALSVAITWRGEAAILKHNGEMLA